GNFSILVFREPDGELKRYLLNDPDFLFSLPQCEIIKDQTKIKVGRVPLEVGGRVEWIYLKRYNAFSWRYRLGSFFVQSPAMRSWNGAETLMHAGFLTGEPIASVEHRSWGMLTKSFYLSKEIPEGKTLDIYWRYEVLPVRGAEGFRMRRKLLKSLARVFRSLHEHGIYHNDLKDVNIVVSGGEGHSFYLLDLEGVRRYRHLKKRRQIKNLVQLSRTMDRFMRRVEKLYWLKEYLGDAFFDRRTKRRWIRRVLRESRRADRRKSLYRE
ncbi:MAG: lipopolysaccharide kinase InaA family protein, partial [Candidatus Binatia bacterium]